MKKEKLINARIRHDTPLVVTTVWAEAHRPDDIDVMTKEQLDGYLLTLGCIYNVSGYYNPYQPKVNMRIINENYILKEGQLCCCAICTNWDGTERKEYLHSNGKQYS